MQIDITNKIYHDEDAARAHLEAQLWPDGPVCPHCGQHEQDKITRLQGQAHRKGAYQCKSCRKQFSVTVGTVFERSKITLNKWVLATHLMAASKKGISAHQLHRMLGITYKSAWFMAHRIREAMGPNDDDGAIGGPGKVVESDETYVGGKARNAHKSKPTPKKHAVVALVDRDGEIRARHVPEVTAKNVRNHLVTSVDRASYLMTDESMVYVKVAREFKGHASVNHSADEYVRLGSFVHVNGAESFFALLKRGVYGAFHAVSEQHLQRYVNEFAFRWNGRKLSDRERALGILRGIKGKRLTYRRTHAASHA